MNRLLAVLPISLVLGASAFAHDHVVLIRGEITVGSLDSAIAEYVFLSESDVGDAIFASCNTRQLCQVRAYVDGDFIVEVVSAEGTYLPDAMSNITQN